ncbi:MAG: alcohol dehydrogenase catalytic domain-containing protein [Clostridia bacterium]|nr:alcohol dehydrogenase catalytic domain-containing protein [Clostridia bacterium]
MKQAFLKAPYKVEIRDTEIPELDDDGALIDVRACGICGSDLNTAQTAEEFRPFGHELSGVVEKVGAGVKNVRPGDKVCVESSSFCGKCAMCRNGHPEMCRDKYIFAPRYNGFAEKVAAKAGALVKFDGITFEEAAVVEPMGVAMDMTEAADIRLNDAVVVYGAGPIALLAVRLARLKGAGRITVLAHSHSKARIRLAEYYGSDRIVCTDIEDPCAALKGDSVDRVLVTTPPATLRKAAEFASFGAIISMIGIAKTREESQCTLDINQMHFKRLQLRYSFASPALFFPLCVDMIKNGLVDVKPLISHRFPLEQMDKAVLACRDDKASAVKVMMVR